MLLEIDDCHLVLVDYQQKLLPAINRGAEVRARALLLAKVANVLGVPTWGTEQNPDRLGPNDAALRSLCQQTFAKMHFGACESDLLKALREPKLPAGNVRSLPRNRQKTSVTQMARNTVVVAGCETHVCLLQTALGLLEEEFDVWVVLDACGSRRERDNDAALDRLAANGVELVTAEMVVFEWLRHCQHPRFKEILELIKP